MSLPPLRASEHLHDVKYEIRGALARRAEQLQREGHDRDSPANGTSTATLDLMSGS